MHTKRNLFQIQKLGGGEGALNYIEQAYQDYIEGMKYKDIAEKYDVSINTVKSWKRRYEWSREIISETPKSVRKQNVVAHKKSPRNSKHRKLIESDLKRQLEESGATHAHYVDLINDYLSLWDVKNQLIEDIRERGVVIEWTNGKQVSQKKNDSISELNKTNAQMLKLLSELGLKATEIVKEDDSGDDV